MAAGVVEVLKAVHVYGNQGGDSFRLGFQFRIAGLAVQDAGQRICFCHVLDGEQVIGKQRDPNGLAENLGIGVPEEEGQDHHAAQRKGEEGNREKIVDLLVGALIQEINDEAAVGSRNNVGQQLQGTVLDCAVLQHPVDDAGVNVNEADHCRNDGRDKDDPRVFLYQGIKDLRLKKRPGAVPDEHQVRPAFPYDAQVFQLKFDKHKDGKDQGFEDQQEHALCKLFIQEGRRVKRHQKGQRYQDQCPVLDEIVS